MRSFLAFTCLWLGVNIAVANTSFHFSLSGWPQFGLGCFAGALLAVSVYLIIGARQ